MHAFAHSDFRQDFVDSLQTTLWRATQSDAWHFSLQYHASLHLEHFLNGALSTLSVTKQPRLLQG
jgi:hypothetical protein